jgi:simple sugar transport system substrate-binding protein
MTRSRRHQRLTVLAAVLLLLTAACSSQGGRQAEEPAGGVAAGQADTPPMTIAMVTHAAPGDTFWDIIQKGAEAAAAKDNAEFLYSSDPDAARQAQLVQAAVDQQVDGLAVTLAKPDALRDAVTRAIEAGIPVVSLNAGEEAWAELGVLSHFGQNEEIAGQAAGEQLNQMGFRNVRCVIMEQGHVGLEARCRGAASTFGGQMENLFALGTNMPQFQSTVVSALQADSGIDGVLTLGAPFALSAVQAVQQAGSSARVATFDMNKDLVAALQDGRVQFAVDQQPFLQGYLAVDALWLYKTNGNIMGGERAVLTGPAIITQDMAETVGEWANRGTR